MAANSNEDMRIRFHVIEDRSDRTIMIIDLGHQRFHFSGISHTHTQVTLRRPAPRELSIHAPLERFRAPAAARHHTPLSAWSPAAPAPVSGLASALATLLERLPHRHTRLPLVQVTRTARGARPAAVGRRARLPHHRASSSSPPPMSRSRPRPLPLSSYARRGARGCRAPDRRARTPLRRQAPPRSALLLGDGASELVDQLEGDVVVPGLEL